MPARSFILYGLRGVGKTVLLNRIALDAEARGIAIIRIEAPEERSLPSLLIPSIRAALIRLSRNAAVKANLEVALRTLGSFAKAVKLKYQDVEFGFDTGHELGIADSGDLELDLTDLMITLGEAALEKGTAIILSIDELQYVPEDQLSALISAFHRVSQNQLPITLVAAGLPQLLGQMGRAKSYAERLFSFVQIDKLDAGSASAALCKPAERKDVSFASEAIDEILRQTQGYPYFLQEWGKHSWDVSAGPIISRDDATSATLLAILDLDRSFFRVRFDRLAPAEKRYMRAMAELGPGPHRSGDIAEKLKRRVSSFGPVRKSLINKGMIYSPTHGDTAFTVPLFDEFMRRTMVWEQ